MDSACIYILMVILKSIYLHSFNYKIIPKRHYFMLGYNSFVRHSIPLSLKVPMMRTLLSKILCYVKLALKTDLSFFACRSTSYVVVERCLVTAT